MQESVNRRGNINQQSRRNQRNQRRRRMNRRFAPTRQHPQPYLNHIHHRQHQKQTPHDGPDSGAHHPEPQNFKVNVRPERFVDVFTVQQIDGQFQSLRHQRREKEEAERDNFEDQELFRDIDAGVAWCSVLETVLTWGCQRKADEDSYGEEGIDVD